jgi:hypothetical protein
MSDGGLKPFRDLTTGVISTVATLATAAAGVLGVLHETGYLKTGATPSPAAIAMPANVQPPNRAMAVTNAFNAAGPANQPFAARDMSASPPGTNFQGAPPNQFRRHPGMRNPRAAPMDSTLASNDSTREFAPRRAAGQADDGAAAPRPQMVAVNGAWKDAGMGFCHVIKQDGAKLEVVNLAPVTSTFVSAGVGTVKGREVHLRLNVLKPAAANAELFLSDDGKKLVGTIKRPDGEHPTAWHRVGATCG